VSAKSGLTRLGGRAVMRRLMSDRGAVAAVLILLLIMVPCAAAPLFAPYNPTAQPDIIALRSQAP